VPKKRKKNRGVWTPHELLDGNSKGGVMRGGAVLKRDMFCATGWAGGDHKKKKVRSNLVGPLRA